MRRTEYQPLAVTLPAATFGRLERGAFNKRRVAGNAVEKIRVALLTIFPPRTPEERNDKSRMQGTGKHMMLLYYDFACHLLRKLTGRAVDEREYAAHGNRQSYQLTLMIPTGFMGWIEKIAQSGGMTIPDATVYAIEYGLRIIDAQKNAAETGRRFR